MPVHEKLQSLRSTSPKLGLRGAVGGRLDVGPGVAVDVSGSAGYDAAILGDAYVAGHNTGSGIDEVVSLTSNAAAWTAGHFHLIYGGQTTGEIPFDATFADILEAFAKLSTVKGGVQLAPEDPEDPADDGLDADAALTFAVTDGAAVMRIRFKGHEGAENVGAVTTDVSAITGGTPSLTAAVVQGGRAVAP